MKKTFALVDCNSFYSSCEKIFRPDLKNTPVIVLSNNDGCIVSATSDAKRLGIKMFAPYFQQEQLIKLHGISVFSSNYALYADISQRVMSTLQHFAPEMEIYSIDEAFLDLSYADGIHHDHQGHQNNQSNQNLSTLGHMIKSTIDRHVGIPVSVGIAPTKVLAKVANHLAKKSSKAQGVVDLTATKFHDVALSKLRAEDVWGIGSASARKLKILGIHSAKDLRDYPNEKYLQKLLTKTGRQIQDELRGISCLELETVREAKKSIVSSRTFSESLFDLVDLETAVAQYTSLAAEKLRQEHLVCHHLSVSIRTNPFKDGPQYMNGGTHTFFCPTSDTRKLIHAAHGILKSLYRYGYEYKKASVLLTGLVDSQEMQLSLLESHDHQRDENLMHTIDHINAQFGRDTLRWATSLPQQTGAGSKLDLFPGKLRRTMKSPCYTTSWSDLPTTNNHY